MGVAGSAVALPVTDAAFDAVMSAGLFHHLADEEARATRAEMIGVTRPEGRIALVDSVLPEPAWRRPLAWAIRRAAALRGLRPDTVRWQTTRVTYARTGREGLCTRA